MQKGENKKAENCNNLYYVKKITEIINDVRKKKKKTKKKTINKING